MTFDYLWSANEDDDSVRMCELKGKKMTMTLAVERHDGIAYPSFVGFAQLRQVVSFSRVTVEKRQFKYDSNHAESINLEYAKRQMEVWWEHNCVKFLPLMFDNRLTSRAAPLYVELTTMASDDVRQIVEEMMRDATFIA